MSFMQAENLNRADLNLLVVFEAIARTRSVTRAAGDLALSQPAVSHALRRLRRMMGDPLFLRGREGLIPTPRAQAALAEVRTILAAAERLLAGDGFDPATTERAFRFAASDYAMIVILPGVAARLRREAPRARLEVSHIGEDPRRRLEADEVDLAFVGAAAPEGKLGVRALFRERFVGLICAAHPLAEKAARGEADLADYLAWPHAVASLRGAARNPVDAALEALGERRRVAMTAPSFSANLAALRGSDLIMSTPARLADLGFAQGLVRFELPFAVPDYPYLMIWSRRAEEDAASRWLRELVAGAAA